MELGKNYSCEENRNKYGATKSFKIHFDIGVYKTYIKNITIKALIDMDQSIEMRQTKGIITTGDTATQEGFDV